MTKKDCDKSHELSKISRTSSAIPVCTTNLLPVLQSWPANTMSAFSTFGNIMIKRFMCLELQEQLANIVKHSEAGKVYVYLKYSQGMIKIITRDNGQGFEINKRRNGLGLSNMVYRLNVLKGNIQICSATKSSTSTQIQFPID